MAAGNFTVQIHEGEKIMNNDPVLQLVSSPTYAAVDKMDRKPEHKHSNGFR